MQVRKQRGPSLVKHLLRAEHRWREERCPQGCSGLYRPGPCLRGPRGPVKSTDCLSRTHRLLLWTLFSVNESHHYLTTSTMILGESAAFSKLTDMSSAPTVCQACWVWRIQRNAKRVELTLIESGHIGDNLRKKSLSGVRKASCRRWGARR